MPITDFLNSQSRLSTALRHNIIQGALRGFPKLPAFGTPPPAFGGSPEAAQKFGRSFVELFAPKTPEEAVMQGVFGATTAPKKVLKEIITKTGFSGFSFGKTKSYKPVVQNILRVKGGQVSSSIHDGALLGKISMVANEKEIPVLLNQVNLRKIESTHGTFNPYDMVRTVREYDEGILIPKSGHTSEKINLIKKTPTGYFVLAANRFNGYGIVTFFERFPDNQKTKNYLASIRKRGSSFVNSGRAAVPSSVTHEE